MPAKSKSQQKAAGAALSAKRGGTGAKQRLKGASRQMYKSMSEKELEKMATTKRKPLPEHNTQKKRRAASR